MNRSAMPMLLLLMACISASPPPEPVVKQVVADYAKLERMTDKPRAIAKETWILCTYDPTTRKAGPHDLRLLHVYMNQDARDAFRKAALFPVGSVIVKEKLDPFEKSPPAALGGMIKRKTSTPPSVDDWEFFYTDEKKNLAPAKTLQSCRDCHANAAKKDFVFGDWAKPAVKP